MRWRWGWGLAYICDPCILQAEAGRPRLVASLGYTQDHLGKQNPHSHKCPNKCMNIICIIKYLACLVVYFWVIDKKYQNNVIL